MSEGRLAKPQLRGLHIARAGKSVIVSAALALLVAGSYKVFITDVKEKKMEDFYKTYDPVKALEVMNNAGLMQSHPKN